jgi:putative endopeptidase
MLLMAIATIIFSCTGSKKEHVGIDPANLDLSVKPGDNFYLYANGGWIKKYPLPPEYSRYGSFDKLQEDNDKMVHDLVLNLSKEANQPGSIAQKIGDFFASGMDSATIEKEGISPLKPELENINKATSLKEIQQLIAQLQSIGMDPLFSFYGEADSKNSEMMIANLSQGGLGLNDRDYYVLTDKHSQEIRTEYVNHIAKTFALAGYTPEQCKTMSSLVMTLETRLAKASKTRLELRDPEANYHKMKLADVQTLAPNYDWNGFFTGVGLSNPGDINVGQPEFFKEVNNALKDVSVDDWKVYLSWNLINNMAPYLNSKFVEQNFDFYGKFMGGAKVMRPRWRRVLGTTNRTMGEALGQMYVKKYFPASSKERVAKLVENLRFALSERIKNLSWMGDSTKQKALEKLAAIRVKIGYPDKWRDYSKLEIKPGAYAMNAMNGAKFNFDFEVSQINKPVDHTRWGMTPQTVNAYYNPSDNEIVFPAAILQPPFFFADGDDAVNYGAIGVVIGHEITHGFDDQGRQYDKKGNLTDWWTATDTKLFKERADVLVQQFNSFVVLDTTHANGRLTLGENIADLGGLNIAYTALQKALKESPAPEKIDGFTPEQRFFLAYAHVWGNNIADKEILRRTTEDVHSLGKYRVNGPLPNLPEFHKAFGIKEGDPMYLPENKRAIIW